MKKNKWVIILFLHSNTYFIITFNQNTLLFYSLWSSYISLFSFTLSIFLLFKDINIIINSFFHNHSHYFYFIVSLHLHKIFHQNTLLFYNTKSTLLILFLSILSNFLLFKERNIIINSFIISTNIHITHKSVWKNKWVIILFLNYSNTYTLKYDFTPNHYSSSSFTLTALIFW